MSSPKMGAELSVSVITAFADFAVRGINFYYEDTP